MDKELALTHRASDESDVDKDDDDDEFETAVDCLKLQLNFVNDCATAALVTT